MKKLNYFSPSIEEFRRYGKVMINEPPIGAHYYIDEDEDLVQKIREMETEDNVVVYAVIRTWTNIGQLDSIVYVDDWQEDWERFDEDADDGLLYTFTWNRQDEGFSDYGSIAYKKTPAAGLMRVLF